jgi:hypothetical protein
VAATEEDREDQEGVRGEGGEMFVESSMYKGGHMREAG